MDFTHYRQTTILRRIQRRMLVHKIDVLDDYVEHMRDDPKEISALYQDMLINVTNFFRNPAVFDAMKERSLSVDHEAPRARGGRPNLDAGMRFRRGDVFRCDRSPGISRRTSLRKFPCSFSAPM